jgi:hypothetical protein
MYTYLKLEQNFWIKKTANLGEFDKSTELHLRIITIEICQ